MLDDLLKLLDRTPVLEGRGLRLTEDSPLMGAVPELDSMGVVSLITAMEERWGFAIDDDEIDGQVFESVGSLRRFVQDKLDGQ